MAFDGTSLCWRPTIPISEATKPRLRIAKMGDGYEQRVLDGINAYDVIWSVSFENREKAVILAMREFLKDAKGGAFPFKHPVDGNTYMVFCDEWRVEWHFRKWQGSTPIDRGTLSADFRKAFGSGI